MEHDLYFSLASFAPNPWPMVTFIPYACVTYDAASFRTIENLSDTFIDAQYVREFFIRLIVVSSFIKIKLHRVLFYLRYISRER